jgi:polyketide cyclase/dehydrase/lipid transport protein
MKLLKRIVIALVAIVVVAVLVSFTMPRHPTVSRSIEIAAPVETIFPIVSDLRRFNEWSPWFERDPEAKYTFTGPVDGVGQTLNWTSKKPEVGSGKQTILRIDAPKEVEMLLDFGQQGVADSTFRLEPDGKVTKVTWGFSSDTGFNPVMRYMGMMFDKWIGPDYEKGLARLKEVSEKPPPGDAPAG